MPLEPFVNFPLYNLFVLPHPLQSSGDTTPCRMTGVRVVPSALMPATNQLLHSNVQRFRGGLVFKAHRLLYHSTLGLRVVKKKKKVVPSPLMAATSEATRSWNGSFTCHARFYLIQSVFKGVLQKLTPLQIRQLILYYY